MKKTIGTTREYAEMVYHLHVQGTRNQTGIDIYARLLKTGVEFKEVDTVQSRKLKKEFKLKLGQCWYNAQKVMISGYREFDYYEGYVGYIIPLEHGWLVERSTGLVVDPTLNKIKKKGDYFGIKIPRVRIHRMWSETGMSRQMIWDYLMEKTKNGSK